MQKSILVIAAILLLGSQSAKAQSIEDIDVLLSAAAGAAIGSTIGDGDGRRIATAIGGLIGANMARDRYGHRHHGRSFYSYCRDRVPPQYRNNTGVARSWIEGCVDRLSQQQRKLEREAYEDGYYGPSN